MVKNLMILILSSAVSVCALAEDNDCANNLGDFVTNPHVNLCPSSAAATTPSAEESKDLGPVLTGMAVQTMDAAGYTYVEIDTKTDKIWLATQKTKIAKGDTISFHANDPYEDFNSPSLKRTFKKIYLVTEVLVNGASNVDDAMLAKEEKPKVSKKDEAKMIGLSAIIRDRKDLKGKAVTVKGRVTKVNERIMGKNWIHISDDSLNDQTQNVTITTVESAKVGDTIEAKGTLASDKDIGSGYFFPVLIEEARVKTLKTAKK